MRRPHRAICQGKVWYGLYPIACAILIGPLACASKPKDGITDEMRAEAQQLFPGRQGAAPGPKSGAATESKPSDSARNAGAAPDGNGWAISLEYVTGPDHDRAAVKRRIALAQELGRADVSVRSRSDGSVVVLGAYLSAADPITQRDLEWVRAVRRGETRPFARAYLLPPPVQGVAGDAQPEWNLAGIRSTRAGAGKELTLQIAAFDGGGSIERARMEAEAYTEELRGNGEDAYYFHGQTLSVVTIGLFDASEADSTGRPASKATRDAHRAHPLNLRDGREPIVDVRGNQQESALMRIP